MELPLSKFQVFHPRIDNENGLVLWFLGGIGPTVVVATTAGLINNSAGISPVGIFYGFAASSDAPGLFRHPFRMDGSTSYITPTDVPEYAAGTVSFWIAPASTINSGVQQAPFSNTENPATATIFMRWGNDLGGALRFGLLVGGVFKLIQTTTTVWQGGAWYLVTGTWDGTNIRLYVNGVQEATVAGGSPDSVVANWNFGRGPCPGPVTAYFNGAMADIRVYQRALDGQQVNALYSEKLAERYVEDTWPIIYPVVYPPQIIHPKGKGGAPGQDKKQNRGSGIEKPPRGTRRASNEGSVGREFMPPYAQGGPLLGGRLIKGLPVNGGRLLK